METVSSSGGDAVGGFFPVCKEWQALRMHVDSDSDAFFGMLINCRGNPAFLMQKKKKRDENDGEKIGKEFIWRKNIIGAESAKSERTEARMESD